MRYDKLIGHIAALLTVIIWGITFISTKILLRHLSPFEILFSRFVLGWLALWLICPVWLGWTGKRQEALFALAGLTGVTLYFLLENIALTYTSAANVSVLVSVAPFFTGLCAWKLMRGPCPGPNFFLGFLVAICGIILVSYNGALLHLNPLGDLLAILAALAWAFYSVIVKCLSNGERSALLITRRIFFYGIILMLPCLFWEQPNFGPEIFTTPEIIFNLAFLGIGASAICFAVWTFCLAKLGAEAASAYIYLVPVITVITAAIILGETITPLCILGCCLTVAGLIFSEWKPRKNQIKSGH